MTRLVDNPAEFADEALAGFVAAHRRWVRRVPGGVIRSTPKVPGHVAVVSAGGSGHYPAFCGGGVLSAFGVAFTDRTLRTP